MATSTTTAWAKGFSENPSGKRLRARSIIEMLDRIGDEKVRAPGVSVGGTPGGTHDDPDALLITRQRDQRDAGVAAAGSHAGTPDGMTCGMAGCAV